MMRKKDYVSFKPMLSKKMENGKRLYPEPNIREIQNRARELLSEFDKSYKRQINPHIYKVSLSSRLRELKTQLIKESKMEKAENR